MKVFNLCCENGHAFEGWFASRQSYEQQQDDGLLECPVCGTEVVKRTPSATRLNLSGTRAAPAEKPAAPLAEQGAQMVAQPTPAQMHRLWAQMASLIQSSTEDVGDRFAEEARRIHYNEAPERGIRGVATAAEAEELADEGIDVMAFPLPVRSKGTMQ